MLIPNQAGQWIVISMVLTLLWFLFIIFDLNLCARMSKINSSHFFPTSKQRLFFFCYRTSFFSVADRRLGNSMCQTQSFIRLSNRSFSSDNGACSFNLALYSCIHQRVFLALRTMHMENLRSSNLMVELCRWWGWSCCPFHGWIYNWWDFGNLLKEYVISGSLLPLDSLKLFFTCFMF